MLIDIVVVMLFFVLRLPLSRLFTDLPFSDIVFRIITDASFISLTFLLFFIKRPIKQHIAGFHRPHWQDLHRAIITTIVLSAFSLSVIQFTPQKQIYDGFFTTKGHIIILLLIISSFSEELFYRGFLLKRLLSTNMQAVYALLISSILFAIGHVYMGLGGVIFSFFSGILLGFVVLRYNSILISMLAHSTYNVLFYYFYLLSSS